MYTTYIFKAMRRILGKEFDQNYEEYIKHLTAFKEEKKKTQIEN